MLVLPETIHCLMEIPSPIPKSPEKLSFYPKRQADAVQDSIDKIVALSTGVERPLQLSETEKEQVLTEENQLGEKLEKVFDLKINNVTLYVDFFLTPQGKKIMEELFPEEVIPSDILELKKLLLKKQSIFADKDFYRKYFSTTVGQEKLKKLFKDKVPTDVAEIPTFIASNEKQLKGKALDEFKGDTLKHYDSEIAKKLAVNADGTLSITDGKIPDTITIGLNPDTVLKKYQGYRELRSQIKKELNSLKSAEASELSKARTEILKMYLTRINELIAENYPELYYITKKAQLMGPENLLGSEKQLIEGLVGSKNIDKSLSRFDKLIHGADIETTGEHPQVSTQLKTTAQSIKEVRQKLAVVNKDEKIREKGLDPEKLSSVMISAEERQRWGEEVLKAYGILSEMPASEFDSQRPGPAPDNNWQFVIRSDRSTMAVDGKQKVIFDAEKTRPIEKALAVGITHEIEGHVLQHLNKQLLPFRLFKKVGGGRQSVFAEAGAVYNESLFIKENFGYDRIPGGAYVSAMEERLRGGNYLDCVKAFYEAKLPAITHKYTDLSTPQAKKEMETLKVEAIDRAKRLFRGADLNSDESPSSYLRSSKDSAYLEQDIVTDYLVASNLQALAYIAGINLDNAVTLMKLGMLDLSKIQTPKFVAKDIWERIKGRFALETAKAAE